MRWWGLSEDGEWCGADVRIDTAEHEPAGMD